MDQYHAFGVVHAKLDVIAVAGIELRAVQLLFRAMLIDAFHAALEEAEIAFDRVAVDVATQVFTATVAHGFVVEPGALER